jgi:hypothetical protein
MTNNYWIRRGAVELGPMPLGRVRAMVMSGELGRSHHVSADGRGTWREVGSVAELWEEAPPAVPLPPPEPPPSPAATPVDERPRPRRRRRRAGGRESDSMQRRSKPGGLGLAGFICSVVGLLLALIPMFIWAFQVESSYAFIPIAFPFLVVSVTGLVLSVAGLFRLQKGFATAGFVVGIVASLIGAVTCVGWLVTPDPRERWVEEALKVTRFDVELADKEFVKTLKDYREGSLGRTDEELVEELIGKLMKLTRAHAGHVQAASRTPRFRSAFTALDRLRAAFSDCRDAVQVKANQKVGEVIEAVGEDPTLLKELLDIHDLYRQQKISLETAQAKCRDMD